MDQTLHRLAETLGIVTPIARQRKLPPALRQLYQHILRHFAQHGTAPEPQRLREWAHQLDIELDAGLDQLVAVDLVEADPATARLLGAYPFSAIPRGHKSPTRRRPHRRGVLRETTPKDGENALAGSATPFGNEEEPRARFAPVSGGS
jgi:hypothetical protein